MGAEMRLENVRVLSISASFRTVWYSFFNIISTPNICLCVYVCICLNMFDLLSSQSYCRPTIHAPHHKPHRTEPSTRTVHHTSLFLCYTKTDSTFQYRDYNMVSLDVTTVWVQVTFAYGFDPTWQSHFLLRITSALTGNNVLNLEVTPEVCQKSLAI